MPKDKPNNANTDGLRQIPKPIQLELPGSRPKPARRLHEREPQAPPPSQERPTPPPSRERRTSDPATGKRYFDSVQKTYGQRRPPAPKPPRQKRRWWYHPQTGPMLGQGDRLYNPPQPKQPFFPPHIWRVVRLWPLAIIGIAIIIMGMINVFSYNAWAVFLDGQLLGHMPINREIEPESIQDAAVRRLQDILGADEVLVNETVEVRSARAGRREVYTAPDMIMMISQNFTYQVMASAIYLDGERVAILRSQADAEHVRREVVQRFENNYTIRTLTTFEQDWQVTRVAINLDNANQEMDNPHEVIQFLERPIQDIHHHTIRSGDTQYTLARFYNTTINMIGYLNDIASDAILPVGDTLLIEITRPRLTVRTVDEITFIETIARETQTVYNENKLASLPYEELIEGRDGEVQVVQRITKLNGVQQGAPEEISRRELSTAVARVIEVGTLETVIHTQTG